MSFTVAISVNSANEFQELFEATSYFLLIIFTEYINESSKICKNVIRGLFTCIILLLLFDIYVVAYKIYFTPRGYGIAYSKINETAEQDCFHW